MTVIVDASVAMKWLLVEEGSESANQLIMDEMLAAPDLLFIECANVLRTKTRNGALARESARAALATLDAIPIRTLPIRPHVAAAHSIALELDRSAYDSLYLAVALAERGTLVTADVKFANAAQAHPVYSSALRVLGA
ncbi:MAG: type II toxin-antitoxin system VapC family toxin [Caulobacterales bacterium]